MALWLAMVWVATGIQRWAATGTSSWGWDHLVHPGLGGTIGRIRWDADRYLSIAEVGYRRSQGDEAAFPGYALLIRALHGPLGGYGSAAAAITLACGLASVLLWWRWMEVRRFTPGERCTGLALFVTFPAMFLSYGIGYSDVLLLVLVLLALLLAESRHPVAAGLVAGLATLTRPNALALIPALAVVVLEVEGVLTVPSRGRGWRAPIHGLSVDRARLRLRHLGPLLSVTGIGAYVAWNWQRTGDPLYFWHLQHDYGHRSLTDPLTWLKANLVRSGNVFLAPLDPVHEALSFAVVVGSVLALPAVGRRIGWGYAVLVLGLATISWGFAPAFAPAARHLLPGAPFVLAAMVPWLTRHRRALAATLVVFVAWQVVLIWGFSRPGDLIINQASW
ncbi:MAG: rane protein [Acidimicrobiales bacterium]|nr:rane protein [Acidimicrobiales bacterium]